MQDATVHTVSVRDICMADLFFSMQADVKNAEGALRGMLLCIRNGNEGALPEAGGGVLTGERLLIGEQQGFVADVELRLVHDGCVLVQAAGHHKSNGLIHALGHLQVCLTLVAVVHEAQIPLHHALQ